MGHQQQRVARGQDREPEALPSQLIRPASGRLTLLLDRDATALLPKPNADGVGVLEVSH